MKEVMNKLMNDAEILGKEFNPMKNPNYNLTIAQTLEAIVNAANGIQNHLRVKYSPKGKSNDTKEKQ